MGSGLPPTFTAIKTGVTVSYFLVNSVCQDAKIKMHLKVAKFTEARMVISKFLEKIPKFSLETVIS